MCLVVMSKQLQSQQSLTCSLTGVEDGTRKCFNCRIHLFSAVPPSMHCAFPQAVKIMNMIKLYGKPIRVNKVLRSWVGGEALSW